MTQVRTAPSGAPAPASAHSDLGPRANTAASIHRIHGASEFHISWTAFHEPSACFRQTQRNSPTSRAAAPSGFLQANWYAPEVNPMSPLAATSARSDFHEI